MGNKIGKRRQVVDEQYTRPQGLYQHRDVDHKKLRKLILDAKLAPCYPGDEECALDLEECPICFLYYPSLNRSRCCMKGICTECFLQMKPHNSTRPIQCPFCKTSTYAVEYRGVRTKEEKGVEQLEEQRVIEAHIRMRRQELQDEEERMQNRQEITSSIRMESSVEAEYQDMSSNSLSVPSSRHSIQGDDLVSSEALCSMLASRRTSHPRPNREDNFDLDLEEIMVMEAIWHSIQEQGTLRSPAGGGSALPARPSSSEDRYDPSGGLACAVATLAEHQHMIGPSTSVAGTSRPILKTLQSAGEVKAAKSCPPGSWTEMSPGSCRAVNGGEGEWSTDYGSEVGPSMLPLQEGDNLSAGHHILPESFEEQMMLAMAVSLAEARARTTTQGLSWL